jgi:ATP-dependent Clp protease protease subunit
LKDKLNRILAENSGQPLSKIQVDVERDYFMDPDQAKEYGLIDDILLQIPQPPKGK